MSAVEENTRSEPWLRILVVLVGLAGMAAFLAAYIGWAIRPEPLLIGPFMLMASGGLGAAVDLGRLRRRESQDQT